MIGESEESSEVSYWPSVSDLFMMLFVIGMVLVAVICYVLLPKSSLSDERTVVEAVGADLQRIREPVNDIRREIPGKPLLRPSQDAKEVVDGLAETSRDTVSILRELQKAQGELAEEQAANLKLRGERDQALAGLNDKPPIIQIEESAVYRFASGSPVMSDAFRGALGKSEFRVLADEILKRNRGTALAVDTLEVIGHTDGQAVRNAGNLDDALPGFLAGGNQDLGQFHAGSNNDLGLLRALAVKQAWDDFVRSSDHRAELSRVEVRCYSAGQTILPDRASRGNPESYRRANEGSRRIEIRLTKLSESTKKGR
jgi:outer membrane protein OmpA-like peptidoglycan-associated protein